VQHQPERRPQSALRLHPGVAGLELQLYTDEGRLLRSSAFAADHRLDYPVQAGETLLRPRLLAHRRPRPTTTQRQQPRWPVRPAPPAPPPCPSSCRTARTRHLSPTTFFFAIPTSPPAPRPRTNSAPPARPDGASACSRASAMAPSDITDAADPRFAGPAPAPGT